MFSKKSLFIILYSLLIIHYSLVAQLPNLTLTYKSNPVKSDSVYTITCKASKTIIDSVSVTNNGEGSLWVLLKKVIIDTLPGTKNNFCWGSYCYPPEVYQVTDSVQLSPDETFSKFYPEYNPKTKVGKSTVKYIFFSNHDAADTASITFSYVSTDDASVNNQLLDFSYQLYPVPADRELNIDLTGFKNLLGLVIFDMNGRKVFSNNFNSNSINKIKTSDLPEGIYNLVLIKNNHIQSLRKFSVIHSK
jgi:hypothetical protein